MILKNIITNFRIKCVNIFYEKNYYNHMFIKNFLSEHLFKINLS